VSREKDRVEDLEVKLSETQETGKAVDQQLNELKIAVATRNQ